MLHVPDGKICGNGRVSAPHTSCATPRRRISSAMLAMKTVNGDSPISGRNSAPLENERHPDAADERDRNADAPAAASRRA